MILVLAAMLAQAAEAPLLEPSGPWSVQNNNRRCELRRSFGQGEEVVLRISQPTLSEEILVGFISPALPPTGFPVSAGTLRDESTGRAVNGRAMLTPGRMLILSFLDQSFLGSLRDDAKLAILLDGESLTTLDLRDFVGGFKDYAACEQALLRSWGVDPAPLAALKAAPMPTSDPASWFTAADYPPASRRRDEEGYSTVRYRVTVEGSVRNCIVVETSGFPLLDDATCALLNSRGRYRPAIGADGRPVEVWQAKTIGWSLAD